MAPATRLQAHFRVSPRVLGPLGAEQLQDPALAVLELVKNSWDADATRVSIQVRQRHGRPSIAVIDNGHGMSIGDFQDRWLVIGASHKRGQDRPEGSRPLIGEKGLGRLASFSLGRSLAIESARRGEPGFSSELDWEQLLRSPSLEDYSIAISTKSRPAGTQVEIRDLRSKWTTHNTDFLVSHAQFLTSVPGEKFAISLVVDGTRIRLQDPLSMISRLAEASMEVLITKGGQPSITSCTVDRADLTEIAFRPFKPAQFDPRLADVRLTLRFFRRDQAAKRLTDVLPANEVSHALERYQGIRIYKNGINVPPYGLNGDDWAALEKQRTATGGPTMVPGNSQLTGELHIPKSSTHLVVTAGRSGFSDQTAVKSLAEYVKWAVLQLGTARRAYALGIFGANETIPGRVDTARDRSSRAPEDAVRSALAQVVDAQGVKADPELRKKVDAASEAISAVLDRNEETLRLYAQLASTGIAATSFAHELRADFDVVSDALAELRSGRARADKELVSLLNESWSRIKAFAALFKVVPMKSRRQRRIVSTADLEASVAAIAGLAPPEKVEVLSDIPQLKVAIVPAELDSVLLNLVSNSVKAIAEGDNADKGKIRVAFVARGADLLIRVADNGVGVSPKIAHIMFEPLEGKFADGTGMGLPITKYIVERYKGEVVLRDPPPKGYTTEFEVVFRDVVR